MVPQGKQEQEGPAAEASGAFIVLVLQKKKLRF